MKFYDTIGFIILNPGDLVSGRRTVSLSLKLFDMHTHTKFSFDGCETAEALCEAALARGLAGIAITDHCDIDGIRDGIYPPFDAAGQAEDVAAAAAKYAGRLRVIRGIELGQGHLEPERTSELMNKYGYEYVLGSLHNLRGVPDFYYMHCELMPTGLIDQLIGRSFDEALEMLECPYVQTLAHLTYPLRYMRLSGVEPDIKKYYPKIEKIYKKLISRGISLEINTSGLRNSLRRTLPEEELVKLYRECGGRLVTLGSDAHKAEDVGADFGAAEEMLRRLGGLELHNIC